MWASRSITSTRFNNTTLLIALITVLYDGPWQRGRATLHLRLGTRHPEGRPLPLAPTAHRDIMKQARTSARLTASATRVWREDWCRHLATICEPPTTRLTRRVP